MTKQENGRRRSSGTRQVILRLLKQDGPRDSTALAQSLGISAMAVRQHLFRLRAEELVSYVEQPRPMGRPAKMWEATAAAASRFPDAHAQLTVRLLGAAEEALGQRGVKRVLSECARSQITDYQSRMPDTGSLFQRVKKLAAIRNEEGFMAAVERQPDGSFLLVENHCAIGAAARACHAICDSEIEVLRAVLGEGVLVERVENVMSGSRRCVYRVSHSKRS